jgi:hypothetical protein
MGGWSKHLPVLPADGEGGLWEAPENTMIKEEK